jgi:hypothetical protein
LARIILWSDAPYTWHMVPAEQRSGPPELAPGQGGLLTIILVNAETGLVGALRAVSLAPRFSRHLHTPWSREGRAARPP